MNLLISVKWTISHISAISFFKDIYQKPFSKRSWLWLKIYYKNAKNILSRQVERLVSFKLKIAFIHQKPLSDFWKFYKFAS